MSLYTEASNVVRLVKEKRGSVKNLIFSSKFKVSIKNKQIIAFNIELDTNVTSFRGLCFPADFVEMTSLITGD